MECVPDLPGRGEVKAVAIVDCVGVRVTVDILLGLSGMLASLSCADSDW